VSTYQSLRLEVSGGVGRIVLNRPPLNVLNLAAMAELDEALGVVGREQEVRVVVLTGEGRAFSAGVDVADHTPERVHDMMTGFHRVLLRLMGLPQPTVAVVNGAALGGGCELLLACDLAVAAEEAPIGQPEIKLGVIAPFAALLLPRVMGLRPALDLLLSGESLKGREAAQRGLVNMAVPAAELQDAAGAFVERLLKLSGAALRLTKRAVALGQAGGLEEAVGKVERLYLEDLMATQDANEGLAAFIERRPPVWRHA